MKRFLIFFISTLFCASLYSQQYNDDIIIPEAPSERNYSIAIGPKAGIGIANGSSTSFGFGLDTGIGYHVGVCGTLHFGHRFESSPKGTGLFGASVELLYESKHLSLDSQTLKLHCLAIPVVFQYYPIASLASEFAIEAGLTFIKGLSCSPEQIQYENMILHTGQLSSNDLMLSFGIGYTAPFNVSFNARYNIGTMPLAGNLDCKTNTLTISAIYYLKF